MTADDPDGLWYIHSWETQDQDGNSHWFELTGYEWPWVGAYLDSPATIEVENALWVGEVANQTAPTITNLALSSELNDNGETVITITGTYTDDDMDFDGAGASLDPDTIYLSIQLRNEELGWGQGDLFI